MFQINIIVLNEIYILCCIPIFCMPNHCLGKSMKSNELPVKLELYWIDMKLKSPEINKTVKQQIPQKYIQ